MRTPPRPIQVLDAVVANQIAAGEVVTRPASVVKELVENAIDAGATRVDVAVDAGGTQRLTVTDDGHGMSADDARLAIERHATSKIQRADDLLRIRTLGFRGEALPSIASVSRFALRTRTGVQESGTELRIEGGEIVSVAPVGCAPGTTVEVADLFFNVPARRKFLRALSTESAHVTAAVRNAALAHPQVRFALARDGRRAQQWLRATSWAERAAQVLQLQDAARCVGQRGPIVVEALVGAPDRARAGASRLHLFVNGRPVQDRALARAVLVAYGSALEQGQHPPGAVFLTVPPELVDVNVHPQKAEVRFAHARAVSDALLSVVRSGLEETFGLSTSHRSPSGPALPAHRGGLPPGLDARNGAESDRWSFGESAQLRVASPHGHGPSATSARGNEDRSPQTASTPGSTAPAPRASQLEFVAQLRDRWLLFEAADGILLVDRIAFERERIRQALQRALDGPALPSQRLLFPLVRALPASDMPALTRANVQLERLGIDLRAAGATSVALHAISEPLATAPAEEVFAAVLEHVTSAGGDLDHGALKRLVGRLAACATCRRDEPMTAARAHEVMASLKSELDLSPGTAAPGVRHITWSELEAPEER